MNKNRRTFLITAVVALVLVAFSARGHLQPRVDSDRLEKAEYVKPANATPSPSIAPAVAVETSVITLTRQGFEPNILKKPGHFALAVMNRCGLDDVALSVDQVNGAQVRKVLVNKRTPDWNDVFTLPPGQYVLNEQNHPEWTCRITVNPN